MFIREFESTDLAQVYNIVTLKKLKFICANVRRLDIYEEDVTGILNQLLSSN